MKQKHHLIDRNDLIEASNAVDLSRESLYKTFSDGSKGSHICYESMLVIETISFQRFSESFNHEELSCFMTGTDPLTKDLLEKLKNTEADRPLWEKVKEIIKFLRKTNPFFPSLIGEGAKTILESFGCNVHGSNELISEATERVTEILIDKIGVPSEKVPIAFPLSQLYAICVGIPGPVSLSFLTSRSSSSAMDYVLDGKKNVLSGRTNLFMDGSIDIYEAEETRKLLKALSHELGREIDRFSKETCSNLVRQNTFIDSVLRNPKRTPAKRNVLIGMYALSMIYSSKIADIDNLIAHESSPNGSLSSGKTSSPSPGKKTSGPSI